MARRLIAVVLACAVVVGISGCGGSEQDETPLVNANCTQGVSLYIGLDSDVPDEVRAEQISRALLGCDSYPLDTFVRILAAEKANPWQLHGDVMEAAYSLTPTAADVGAPKAMCEFLAKNYDRQFWPDLCEAAGVKEPKAPAVTESKPEATTTEALDPCLDEERMVDAYSAGTHPEEARDAQWLLDVCLWRNGKGPDPGPAP